VEAHRLFVRAGREFCRRGLLVVRFDFWGSGESEGEFHEASFASEVEDLGYILGYVLERPEADPGRVGVLGLSMGGAVAIYRASKDQRIRFVCSWAAPADFSLLEDYARRLIEPGRVVGEFIDLPSGFRVSVKTLQEFVNYDVAGAASRISPRPLLVVHGTNDTIVPPIHADLLYNAAGEPREKILVEDADHTFTGYETEWRVISATADWVERALGRV